MKIIKYLLLTLLTPIICFSQSIDKIEAVIGSEMVLTSEIESQYLQYLSQGFTKSEDIKCDILDDLLFQNLLVHHAKLDSNIEVSNEDISKEVNKRVSYFEKQLGSIDKVEEYFKKELDLIKQELSAIVKNQLFAQKMQSSISNNIKVTPSEVKYYFSKLNFDEIPFVDEQIEIKQIVINPKISNQEKESIREKLDKFRKRVYDGEDFKVLAALYSDDPGTSNNGGDLGWMNRGELVPKFERAAFRLKDNEISEVIETEFGFHIIQMISRRGEQINVRHILLKPKISSLSLKNASDDINKIKSDLDSSIITFEDAIKKYSEDESKNNGGLLINPETGSSKFTFDQLNPSVKYIVKNMSVNDVSPPTLTKSNDNEQSYRIIMINSKVPAHQANVIDDYMNIQEFAIRNKKEERVDKWINDKLNNTFVRLSNNLTNCDCYNKWTK